MYTCLLSLIINSDNDSMKSDTFNMIVSIPKPMVVNVIDVKCSCPIIIFSTR